MANIQKILFIAAASLTACLYSFAQKSMNADDFAAKISFAKTVVNVGTISKDTTDMHFQFPFVNTGNAPLVLTYVHPSCSCMRVEYPRQPIAPGDSGRISTIFLPSTIHEKDFKRHILIKSNAEQPPVRLFIVGKFKD